MGVVKVIGSKTKGYICDGCGKAFHWDASSSWYGSLKDMDNQNWDKIWIACNSRCAANKPEEFPNKAKPKSKETICPTLG